MKKKILSVLLALTMVVTGIYVTQPMANEAWAADAQQISDEITPDAADEGMLDIKMQTSEVYDFNGKDAVDLRVVSSVNGLGYSYVGFNLWYGTDITINADTGAVSLSAKPTATYKTKSVAERINAEEYKYSPKVVDTSSEYFVTATIEGILVDNFNKNFYIEAYCVPLAGADSTDPIHGTGKLFNIEQAKETINIAVPQGTLSGTTIENVTVGGETATAELAGYYNGYAHLYVTVDGGKTSLPSASKIVVGGDGSASYAIYRNLETDYTGNNADTSWYTVYEAEGENKFVIATDADLYGFAKAETNFAGKTIYMVADIDANDGKGKATATEFTRSDEVEPYPWSPIGIYTTNADFNFAGTFDGQMHEISGVHVSQSGNVQGSWGLFGETGLCTIKNLIFANSSLTVASTTSNTNLAAIAGKSVGIVDTIKVENDVYVEHKTSTKIEYTGGIVGWMGGTVQDGSKITNCQFSGQITASDYVGGILGECADGNDVATAMAGHKKAVEIKNCLNNGKIVLNQTGNCIGGICGEIQFGQVAIDNSLNVATIDRVNDTYGVNSLTTGTLIGWLRNNYQSAAATTDGTENVYAAIINNSYGISEGNWKSLGYRSSKGHANIDGVSYPGGGGAIKNLPSLVSASALTGGNGYANLNLDFTIKDICEGVWTVTETTPVLTSFLSNEAVFDLDEGRTPRTFWYTNADADATTYTLYSTPDMLGFASLVNSGTDFSSKTVRLGADITINKGEAKADGFVPEVEGTEPFEWTPINITGIFDGDGHTLRGVYVDAVNGDGSVGLFSTVSGTVKDLRLLNSYFHHADTTTAKDVWSSKFTAPLGSIAGTLSGTLDTVYSDAVVNHAGAYAGGLVGAIKDQGTTNVIKNCCYAGSLNANSGLGGILGVLTDTTATIEHCLNIGLIAGNYYSGGICGYVRQSATTKTVNLQLKDSVNLGRRTIPSYSNPWTGNLIGYLAGQDASVPIADITNTYAIGYYLDDTVEGGYTSLWQRSIYITTNGAVYTDGTLRNKVNEGNSNNVVYNYLREDLLLEKESLNLSFQTEGADNTDNYWVAREGKIPMLASFEDLLTNVTY